MLFDSPTQKFGYLDIKQSSKVKGRKLKTWRRRWLVLTKMTDMSNHEYVAKLDLYTSESSWKSHDSEKTTFMLENISCIQSAKSKTHPNAFEIVEQHPILVLSGASDLESYSWILTLQQMLTPEQIETKKDSYLVNVVDNECAQKWNLNGQKTMNVSPACISLVDSEACVISWGLSTLIRFNVEKNPNTGLMNVLMIECGPHSSTGQSCFRFLSDEAQDILSAIRQSICLALAQKQIARRSGNTRPRAVSVTVSEKSFQHLLDTIPVIIDSSRDRSESDSSNSITGTSPTMSVSPASIKQDIYSSRQQSIRINAEQGCVVRTSSELEALVESDEHLTLEIPAQLEVITDKETITLSADPNKDAGYSVIKKVTSSEQSNNNILFSTPSDQSADVATGELNAKTSHRSSENIDSTTIKSDRSDHNESTNTEQKNPNIISIRTMTLPLMTDEKRSAPHYQDIQRISSKDPLSPKEVSPKKRSSSTGDLQMNMKHSESEFENDYEELDDLRASVQRLKLNKQSDSPPALPARPSPKRFMHNKLNSSARMETKKKRPFFKWSEKSVRHSDEDVSPKTDAKLCTCSDIGAERLPFVSDSGLCVVCQGTVEVQQPKRRVPSKETLLSSTHSSLNDLYSSIPEVSTNLTKRRRSSDITPVSSSFFAACDISLTDIQKQAAQNSAAMGLKDSPVSQSVDGECALKIIPKPLQYNSSDPLISFFVDDEQFFSNPMVTGKKKLPPTPPTTPTTTSCGPDLLIDSPVSPLPVAPFVQQRAFLPPSHSHYPMVAPQTLFPFVILPFPLGQMSPTSETLPNAMLWNQGAFGTPGPEFTFEDSSYISMQGGAFQVMGENELRSEETSGVYVGPSHRTSGDFV